MAKVIVKLKPQGKIPSSHCRIEIKFHYFSKPRDLKTNKKEEEEEEIELRRNVTTIVLLWDDWMLGYWGLLKAVFKLIT